MATGKPPFIELGSPEAAMFKVGFYKMHPEVPKELSEETQVFILRCFEPDPEKRAKAADLLEDTFITDMSKKKKISNRLQMIHPDFSRSASTPVERGKLTDSKTETTNDNSNQLFSVSSPQTHKGSESPAISTSTASSNVLCSTMVNRVFVSDQIEDQTLLESRQSSTGALLSPDVLEPAKDTESGDNFYLLKKDSQRRLTLTKVLQQDKNKICKEWELLLKKELPDSNLKLCHLQKLLNGIKSFIPEQNYFLLDSIISALKDDFQNDPTSINQISMALYIFQHAVNSVLRSHSIKPHWMFALDNLVRSAVQAAITVLSPELGAHLTDPDSTLQKNAHNPIGKDGERNIFNQVCQDGASTSGISTVNSVPHDFVSQGQSHELNSMREENSKLYAELIEIQKQFQHLLKQVIFHQQSSLCVLREAFFQENERKEPVPPIKPKETVDPDYNLVSWLKSLKLNDSTIKIFVAEELTFDDVLHLISREELKQLGLKTGPELRIWKAICDHRSKN